jgi:hypothetical protein
VEEEEHVTVLNIAYSFRWVYVEEC